ncbi:hypothetical protein F2P56_027153, partial [Juglans regia]
MNFKKVWRLNGSFMVHEICLNLFVFVLEIQKDKEKVMSGKLWLFDNQLLVLNVFDGMTLQKMCFNYESFWVRLNNLPLDCMTREVGFQIGATIGIVHEVDINDEGIGWGSDLRVRIELDVRKIIARGRTSNLASNRIWVPLTYEKLPKLCFKCRRIKHDGGGCDGNGDKNQYGSW